MAEEENAMAVPASEPHIDVLQPNASSREDHLFTVRIEYLGRRVHVLFHEKDAYRFRVNDADMTMNEFYTGGPQGHTILGVKHDPSS